MERTLCSAEICQQVLESLPQKPPFLFLDKILEMSTEHIIAEKTFTGAEDFYKGHFPGDPVTPGVILAETMAQAGLVALGIYLLQSEQNAEVKKIRTLFSECNVEFLGMVRPGERVIVKGEREFWRRLKLRSKVEMINYGGQIVASGVVSGLGVRIDG
jgi:3-hydroxyacyl-[acyl-carrier-protein] dehydratase